MRNKKIKDKEGKIIKAGDIILYMGRRFDVIKYEGIFGRKGRLKIMEQKSMFEGAVDGWLDELKGQEIKLLSPNKK